MRLAITTAASDATPIIARPKQTSPGIEYEGKSGRSIVLCSSQRRAGAQASDLITAATGYVVMRGMLPCPGGRHVVNIDHLRKSHEEQYPLGTSLPCALFYMGTRMRPYDGRDGYSTDRPGSRHALLAAGVLVALMIGGEVAGPRVAETPSHQSHHDE
jgi:hypothetical protein